MNSKTSKTSKKDTDEDFAMQCGGCGSKASSSVLEKSLPKLDQGNYDHVLLGIESPDDIALIANRQGYLTAASTDFFTAFVDDPFLLGRIAALNALSDLYAKGSVPSAALCMAILPFGSEEQQARLLNELLQGAIEEFRPAKVPIVGGHSIMSPKLTFGFTILGDAKIENVTQKTSLLAGHHLVLTKPLGTGVLLAAHMRAACRAEWWEPLIESMLVSNRDAAAASHANVSAATDVTGFGLAGHLLEMLSTSDLAAELSLGKLPVLPGANELLADGFESTLVPSNRKSCQSLFISPKIQGQPEVDILFDPQTSGGLLLGVPEDNIDLLLSRCGGQAKVIGRVVENKAGSEKIKLLR